MPGRGHCRSTPIDRWSDGAEKSSTHLGWHSNHGVWRGCTNTATHAIASNATQDIEDIGFCGRLGQLGETVEKTLEAHGVSTQSLRGNSAHVGVASAYEGLEMDSVINITTNLRAIEQPRLDSVRTCNEHGVHASRYHEGEAWDW